MDKLNELLERKRVLTEQFKAIKSGLSMPAGGIAGLFTADLGQFKPLIECVGELMAVSDEITNVLAEKIQQLEA